MNPWEQLLAVQVHDTALDQLEHRRASIPEKDELAGLPEEYARVDRAIGEQDEQRHALQRDQKRLEDEVGSLNERRDQAAAKLYDGSVTAPKELSALQDDIASIERRISSLEDETLEVMEQLEPVDAELERLAGERRALDERSEQLQAAIAAEEERIDDEVSTVRAERAASVDGVDDELLALYDTARGRLGGVAVARLVGGTCDGCHMSLPAVEVDRIKHLPVTEPVTCEECGRFLVR